MSDLELLLGGEIFRVQGLAARLACDRLAQDPRAERLQVRSVVSADVFRLFRSAVEGEVIEITNANIKGLSVVCDEFGFGSISQRLRAFKDGPAHQKVRIGALEGRARLLEADFQARQKVQIDALEEKVLKVEADVQASEARRRIAAALMRLKSDGRTLDDRTFPRLDSVILPALPDIFAEFRGSSFGFCGGTAATASVRTTSTAAASFR
jgi:hypothetical protein